MSQRLVYKAYDIWIKACCVIFLQDLIEELRAQFMKKKNQIACMLEKTSEVRRMKDELHQTLALVGQEFVHSFKKKKKKKKSERKNSFLIFSSRVP